MQLRETTVGGRDYDENLHGDIRDAHHVEISAVNDNGARLRFLDQGDDRTEYSVGVHVLNSGDEIPNGDEAAFAFLANQYVVTLTEVNHA